MMPKVNEASRLSREVNFLDKLSTPKEISVPYLSPTVEFKDKYLFDLLLVYLMIFSVPQNIKHRM
jgi:hypothetical protein